MSNAGLPPLPPRASPMPDAGRERSRRNRGWLALTLASLVLLGVGLSVMLIGMNSRSDAESDRDRQSELLASQRRSTKITEQQAQQRRAQAVEVASAADGVLNLATQISQKDDQLITANQDAVNTFPNPDPSAFNSAIDRANAIIDEIKVLEDQINAAIEALTGKVHALR